MTDSPKGKGATGENLSGAKLKPAIATRPALLRKLLIRKSGATIAQIQKAFGWQPHTARAAISGLRKAGEVVDRSDGLKGSVYRIGATKVAS